MQNEMDILKRIEGVDETGRPRAICNISIHKNSSVHRDVPFDLYK